jgi:histidinol-phosphatase (PHP family)
VKLVDLHVHSTLSADGESGIADHARRAAVLGLAEVGFCEHADFDPRDQAYKYLDMARYDQEIRAVRATMPGVQVRKGVEITYQASLEDEIRAWLSEHAADYVVASVHLVEYADGWTLVSEPRAVTDYFKDHSQRQAYVPYFEELLRAVRCGLGDVLGHFDLIKRYGTSQYGPFEPTCFEEEIREVLRSAVEKGVGLEINTSGWRQPPGEPYPALQVLRWYRELGGEILTVGSDAHHVDQLGAGISEALHLARVAGFRAITTFQAHQPQWIDLEGRT